jgi:hypothetical protein
MQAMRTLRTLEPVPATALDPVTGAPRAGSYRGALERVDLSRAANGVRDASPFDVIRGAVRRTLREKRWVYMGMATGDVYVGVAVVRLGYAANAFVFAYDGKQRTMLADVSMIAPTMKCTVGDTSGEGCVARFRTGSNLVAIERAIGSSAYVIEVRTPEISVDARLDTAKAPPSVTAIADLADGRVNTTEKRTLLATTGEVRAGRERRSLDGALGGYDYTHGLLERRTRWRWGFALGRATSGERIAFNLVEGFVGESECAVWIDGEVHPVAEGRFAFDARKPLDPWNVRTADDAFDLRFVPGGMHADNTNLGVIRSRFVQPAGAYSGRIRAAGKTFELKDVLGVSEDQDVLW